MFPLSVIINSDVTSRNQLQCHVGDNVLLLYDNICHQHRSCSRNIIHPDSLISYISDSFYMVLVVLCHGIFSSRLQIIGNSSLEQVQNQLQILLEQTSVVQRSQIIQECILKNNTCMASLFRSNFRSIRTFGSRLSSLPSNRFILVQNCSSSNNQAFEFNVRSQLLTQNFLEVLAII